MEIGADGVQLFAQSPRECRFPHHDPTPLDAFRTGRVEAGLGAVFIHALYLLNLASDNADFYEKSASTLLRTAETATAIEADGVVLHLGSHRGAGLEDVLDSMAAALEPALDACQGPTWLLVENTAGAGGTIGRSIEELATIHERLGRHRRLGLCLDSCHLYASGYDVTDPDVLDTLLAGVDGLIGLDRLRCLHVNDSQAPLGSNRDRHDAVPNGLMGERLGVFLAHRLLQDVPVVLETGSKGHSPSAEDVLAARELHARSTSTRPASPGRARGTRARRGGTRRTRG